MVPPSRSYCSRIWCCWYVYSSFDDLAYQLNDILSFHFCTELHQLTSPNTAYQFLDDMLKLTHKVDSSVSEVELFGQYIWKSWAGIIRSSGVLP